MSIFGDNIKRLRKNKGLKQQEIAEHTVTGKMERRNPNWKTMLK